MYKNDVEEKSGSHRHQMFSHFFQKLKNSVGVAAAVLVRFLSNPMREEREYNNCGVVKKVHAVLIQYNLRIMTANELTPLTGIYVPRKDRHTYSTSLLICSVVLIVGYFSMHMRGEENSLTEGAAWKSEFAPYSVVDPRSIGFKSINRSYSSTPGHILKRMQDNHRPLPTNSWCENLFLGLTTTSKFNRVFQVPYILGTGGPVSGIEGVCIYGIICG